MNKAILMGRLTRDPEVRYTSGENSLAIARYTLAVDRKIRKDGDATADFIPCVVFGRSAEFVEKYFRKIEDYNRRSYSDRKLYQRDGQKVYTTEVVVEEQEFAESKSSGSGSSQQNMPQQSPDVGPDGFMNIPDGIEEELPFS